MCRWINSWTHSDCYNSSNKNLMTKISLHKGDITQLKVDAIVNAANSSLLGGGGVDSAIHRAGGSAILEDCKKIRAKQGGCRTGEAVITTAGKLPSKKVIHTVGPVWSGHDKEEKDKLLMNCYKNSLTLAVENNLTSIAFPNISTGIYHFPKERAAAIATKTVQDFLMENDQLKEVIFVCFDEENHQIYNRILAETKLSNKTNNDKMKIAVFPGSFDPITVGHVDLVRRALPLFDKIIVAVGINENKKYLFTLDQRLETLEKVFADDPKVEVDSYVGLTAHYCSKINARYMIRGLRNASDFDYEKTISQLNGIVGKGLETIFWISHPEYSHISSTIVREIIKGGGDASPFLPPEVKMNF